MLPVLLRMLSVILSFSIFFPGGCRVYVPLMGGELLELSSISEGETFGEIGVLLGDFRLLISLALSFFFF